VDGCAVEKTNDAELKGKKMLYEIVNPSDPYTIEAPTLAIAAAACLLLGDGQYGFDSLDEGGQSIPALAFGGSKEWFEKHFGRDVDSVIGQVMAEQRAALADCMDSCLIGNADDRELFRDATKSICDADERYSYWFAYHDKRRSSMNDIGGRAKAWGKKLRTAIPMQIDPVPQQVFTNRRGGRV
jgi:hypothetical protein